MKKLIAALIAATVSLGAFAADAPAPAPAAPAAKAAGHAKKTPVVKKHHAKHQKAKKVTA